MSPAITVLMPVFNARDYLAESLESVLGQSFGDFELLVIDDGSADGTGDYFAALADPRVRVLRNDRNLGLTRSLNRGLDAATGRYIARMDADDIAEPRRLERQVELLSAHSSVGIVGSGRRLIDEGGRSVAEARAVPDDLGIRWKCLLGNPFAHPTVMLRREVLDRHHLRYDPAFRTAQDYELWTRLLCHTRAANLERPLLRYRLRDGISRTSKAEQLANHDRIALAAVRRLVPGFAITPGEVTELRGRFGGFSVREPGTDPADTRWMGRYLQLLDAFAATHLGEPGIDEFCDRQRQNIVAARAA